MVIGELFPVRKNLFGAVFLWAFHCVCRRIFLGGFFGELRRKGREIGTGKWRERVAPTTGGPTCQATTSMEKNNNGVLGLSGF